MSTPRREFLSLLSGSITAAALAATPLIVGARPTRAAAPAKIKAVAFDAFPVFDPRPIFALAEALFPGKGAALGNAWRTRQFEYTWLRTTAGRYADFWQVTDDALVFAAKQLQLELTAAKRAELMNAYLALKAWPDAPPALAEMKAAGLRLGFLSNFTPRMLEAAIRGAGLDGTFEHALSTDLAGAFKPDPRAYRLAIDAFKLKREEILFVAFAGWDAAGAKMFGYTTFWVNRLGLPPEELGLTADGVGRTLADLVRFVKARA